jgi:hypothetical protein
MTSSRTKEYTCTGCVTVPVPLIYLMTDAELDKLVGAAEDGVAERASSTPGAPATDALDVQATGARLQLLEASVAGLDLKMDVVLSQLKDIAELSTHSMKPVVPADTSGVAAVAECSTHSSKPVVPADASGVQIAAADAPATDRLQGDASAAPADHKLEEKRASSLRGSSFNPVDSDVTPSTGSARPPSTGERPRSVHISAPCCRSTSRPGSFSQRVEREDSVFASAPSRHALRLKEEALSTNQQETQQLLTRLRRQDKASRESVFEQAGWEEKHPRLAAVILLPASRFSQAWASLQLLLVVFSMWATPIDMAYAITVRSPSVRAAFVVIDSFFMLAIPIGFLSAYSQKGANDVLIVVKMPALIAKRYAVHGLLVDVLSAIPVDAILWGVAAGDDPVWLRRWSHAWKVVHLVRVATLLRIMEVGAQMPTGTHP